MNRPAIFAVLVLGTVLTAAANPSPVATRPRTDRSLADEPVPSMLHSKPVGKRIRQEPKQSPASPVSFSDRKIVPPSAERPAEPKHGESKREVRVAPRSDVRVKAPERKNKVEEPRNEHFDSKVMKKNSEDDFFDNN